MRGAMESCHDPRTPVAPVACSGCTVVIGRRRFAAVSSSGGSSGSGESPRRGLEPFPMQVAQ